MPSKSRAPNGAINNTSEPSERTPLIPGPSTVDGSVEETSDQPTNGVIIGTNPGPSTTSEDGSGTQSLTGLRIVICTIALSFLIFLQATNISMLTTTQSHIAAELDAFELTSWFTSAYLIAMSALAPLNGKLSSVFSPRICVFVSTLILAVGSLVTGLAGSFESFVVGRAITGIGASGVFTISIIIVLELSSPQRRGLAIGLLNSGYTVGVAVGATAAGALVATTGWRALFYMQAPVSVIGGTGLLLALPHDFNSASRKSAGDLSTLQRLSKLDYLGALTLTGAIVSLLYGLSSPTAIPILPIILSAIILLAFVLNEVYVAADPIIPISLLKSRGLLLTCLGTTGFMAARWSVLFFTPTYALAVRQWSPATAGSILIPTNAGFAAGGLLVGWLHVKRQGSFYLSTVVSYAILPLTLIALAYLSTEYSPVALVILDVLVCGAATGSALNYTLAHILHLTPKETHYIASSLLATFRGFAGSFGSAIGGGFFARTLSASLKTHFAEQGLKHREDLMRRLLGSPALVGELTGREKLAAIAGYQDALKALFLAAAGLAILMVFVQAGTGWKGVEGNEESRDAQENESADVGRERRGSFVA